MNQILELHCLNDDNEDDGLIYIWFGPGVVFYTNSSGTCTIVEALENNAPDGDYFRVKETPTEIMAMLNKRRFD